jgi:hypothetical protein
MKKDGGGILVAVKKHINVVRQASWESGVEDVWLTIMSRYQDDRLLNICLCYLPPDLPLDSYNDFHHNCQRLILNSTHRDEFLLLGDFNTGNITWSVMGESRALVPTDPRDGKACTLSETISSCDLAQFNTIPNKNNRFLDLVLSSLSSVAVMEADPLCRMDSHHLAYCLQVLDLSSCNPLKPRYKKRYNFYKCRYENLKVDLSNVDWNELFSGSPIDDCLTKFYNKIEDIIAKNTPLMKNSSRNNFPIWYSDTLKRCIKEKIKFHKRYKRFGNPRDYDTFALLRIRSKSLIDECYRSFLSTIEDSLTENPKIFWRYVNGRKGRDTLPDTMTLGNETSCDAGHL